MAAMRGLPEGDIVADLFRSWQAAGWNEGVVSCIQRQGRYTHAREQWFGRGATPVVFNPLETMQWRGEQVVEGIEVTHRLELVSVKKAGVLRQLGTRLGLHGAQEHARVHLTVEAPANRMTTGRQVKG